MTVTVTVIFPNEANAKYNVEYYINIHMPLIEKEWRKYGLKSWSVTRFTSGPNGSRPLYAFGSVVTWDNEADLTTAFAGPEAAAIMDDLPNFSNKTPITLIGNVV